MGRKHAAPTDQDRAKELYAPHLDIFRLLGIRVDVKELLHPERPSLEVIEDATFVACDYTQPLRIHSEFAEQVETVMSHKRAIREQELAATEKRKPRQVTPFQLDEDGAIPFRVTGRAQIEIPDRFGSVIDVANPLCMAVVPGKTYDAIVVAWEYDRRRGTRHGRAIPLFFDQWSQEEWVTPVEGAANVVQSVAFYPGYRMVGRDRRPRKVMEAAAYHTSGMRIVLGDRFTDLMKIGEPLEVDMWVRGGMIRAVPHVEAEKHPEIVAEEASLIEREGPPMAENEIIMDGRIVSVWEVLEPLGVKPDMGLNAFKKAKRHELAACHPDKWGSFPEVVRNAKETRYTTLLTAFNRAEDLLNPKKKGPDEASP